MKILLYQPDIAGNVGTIIRMCACLGLELNIIEPCGFPFDDERVRRASMGYFEKIVLKKYNSFEDFRRENQNSRVVLLTIKSSVKYCDFEFKNDDILMAGRETSGVPDKIHKKVDERVVIPMKDGTRCLNVAISLAMVTGEALRQCKML